MARIRTKDLIEAARNLRSQLDGKGPILGFTFHEKGEPCSVTFDFNETDENDFRIVSSCLSEFAKCLNDVLKGSAL